MQFSHAAPFIEKKIQKTGTARLFEIAPIRRANRTTRRAAPDGIASYHVMNSPQRHLRRAREAEEQAATDLKRLKTSFLEKVIPKTIVREQCNPTSKLERSVRALVFNHLPGNCGNLFATIGGDFATVYDDEHFGDHVAVVCQFKNEATDHTKGGDLTAVCWVDPSGYTAHELGDATLAVAGGDDNAVQVISFADGRVVSLMKGHTCSILAVAAGSSEGGHPERLVSLDAAGNAVVWNWRTQAKLGAFQVGDAISLAVNPDGSGVYTGHKGGFVKAWTLPESLDEIPEKGIALGVVCHGKNPVDCLRVTPGKLFSKSVDGTIGVLDLGSGKTVQTWKVEDCVKPSAKDLLDGLTGFGVDPAGEFLAVGNGEGEVATYDVATGQVIKIVEADRDFKHLNLVRAAGVSRDCRHVHAAFGPGIVWRFEVVPELDDEDDGTEGPGTPPEEDN